MQIVELLEWWNLIFVLPFFAATLQMVLQAMGLIHIGHGMHHIHIHHDHSVGHSHVVPHGHAHAHHESGGHTNDSSSAAAKMLSLMGIGKAPFMVILSCFSILWGSIGLCANQIFGVTARAPQIVLLPSIGLALLGAFLLTGILANIIGKMMPSTETYGQREAEFVGQIATAVMTITSESGVIAVLDAHKNRIEMKCVTDDGSSLPSGSSVLITNYEEEKGRCIVCPFEA